MDSRTAFRIARDAVAAGPGAESLVGAIRCGNGLALLNADGTASKLRVAHQYVEGVEVPRAELIHERLGVATVVDSGTSEEMFLVVEALTRDVERRVGSTRCRRAKRAICASGAVLALAATFAGGFVLGAGPPPNPNRMPQIPPGAAVPGAAPAAVSGMLTPERIQQMLRDAAAERGVNRVETPVPLVAPTPRPAHPPAAALPVPAPAAPGSSAPTQRPGPRADAPASAPERVAANSPVASAPALAAPAETAQVPDAVQPGTVASTPASPEGQSAPVQVDDAEAAQRLLATLQGIRQSLSQGAEVTPEMLSSLPPAIAERLQAARSGQQQGGSAGEASPEQQVARMTPQAMARAGKDPFGIPNIPEANTWAGTNGRVRIPLPGGGDIRKPDDMVLFGLEP